MPKRLPALNEADLEERFSRSSGPGGQNVNKVSTKVTLRHVPSGVSVTVQDSRSQAANRRLARERLSAELQRREEQRRAEARERRERARRQRAPRPRAVKDRMLEHKRHRSAVKQRRQKIDVDE